MSGSKNKVRTGNLTGGSHNTRVHPDSASEIAEKRLKALKLANNVQEDTEMGTATVAKGRTVHCPAPGETAFVAYDKEGEPVFGPVLKYFGPDETVELPVREIIRLRGLGFLTDPDKRFRTHKDIAAAQGHHSHEPRARVISNDSRPGASISAR